MSASSSTVGLYERWWLENDNNNVHIQNAGRMFYFIGLWWQGALNAETIKHKPISFVMEFYPCEKKAWWNYGKASSA